MRKVFPCHDVTTEGLPLMKPTIEYIINIVFTGTLRTLAV